MSKNAFIDLIARLNRENSKSQIQTDLEAISGELNGLKDNGLNIQCHIDTSSEAVNRLQGELNTLASKLKLNIGVDAKSIASTVASKTQSDNSATTSTVKIDKMSAQSQVEELGKLLRSNLKGEADAVLKGLLEETRNTLGQTTEIWTTWERNAEGALKNFSISAKQATGDLQKFNYAVGEGNKVSLLSSNGSDRGILQKQKETLKFIDEYTSKINSLRSSSNGNFTTAYNGETVGFKSLLDDLEKLRNGEGSVEDIRAKFVALQGTIDSIKVTVKESQGKSLNPFTNANITAKEFDNTLKSVKVDLDNLKGFKTNNDSIPTVKELNKEYKDLSKAISTLNQVEESQRGNQWYLDFASASERVRQLQSDIKLLNKLKREDTSSGTKKQTEELLKIAHAYRELQKLEERRFSGKAGNTEINQINSLEGGYRRIINTAQDRLKKQELLTSEVKKTIAEEEKALNIARNLAKAKLQDKSITQENARIEKERSNIVGKYIDDITKAYAKMQGLSATMSKPNVGSATLVEAQTQYEVQQGIVKTKERELEIYLSSLSVGGNLTEEEQKKLDIARQELQSKLDMQAANIADANAAKQQTKEAKAQQETYNQIVLTLNKYKNSLGGFNNSNIIKQNGTNGDVMKQLSANKSLLQQIESISALLSNGKNSSAANIAQAKQELDKLIPSLETAKKDSDNLNQSLKDDKITRQVTNKFNTLKNQIETFASVNKKATESTLKMSNGQTFKDNWETIVRTLYSGNLQGNAAEIEKLAIAFRDLNGQARSAGLTTSQFFTNMGSQLKMVLNRYISLYAVIGYIRKMVDNVKALDEAMINLRRVTDETDSGYLAFLEKANKQAQDLKVVTSDLVEQTYQWAKLGYDLNDALELSRASTIFSKVADVSQETAQKNLVTALKAYGKEAKDVMLIVDQLDTLNNKYAVDAAGLGDGLERSASAMAMTGNSLEQTIAMLTGAGEITQNMENTGSALKIVALRLQNMKGALEELNEPVDDLMEVSKVQTQILNLTHNQVDIFDKRTKEFRSTYDIMKDISEIWDSLNSTSRASLTEILFGKNRANIGLALIQSFQSGQTQKAFKDTTQAAGTATAEYEKMMDGIEAHSNALKGSFQELSNTVLKKETINFFIDSGKRITDVLAWIIKHLGSISVIMGVIFTMISVKSHANFIGVLKGIAQWLGIITTNAENARSAMALLKSAGAALGSLLTGLAIGALVKLLSWLIDKLIITRSELDELAKTSHDALVDLKQNIDELKQSEQKLDSIAQSYSKIATTVTDVSERKMKLQELQNDLVTSYNDEADGVDLVNGKYSEQLKKLDEIAKKEKENFETDNAAKIAKAQALSSLYVDDSNFIYNGDDSYISKGLDKNVKNLFEVGGVGAISQKDFDDLSRIASQIEGVRKGASQTIYLSGDIETAKNQLEKFIVEYSKVKDRNLEILDIYSKQYEILKADVELLKNEDIQPYLKPTPETGTLSSIFSGTANTFQSAMNEVSLIPFNNKLDEAQAKLQQLANPDDLSLSEYSTLSYEVQGLEDELYKMAGSSEDAKQKVSNLFNAFKQGTSENGDRLDKFVENFESDIEDNFKGTAEIVTNVQEAISKLGEGKGMSHTDAWKLLKADTEGYLQTIKLVNGEYVFSEKELIKLKDKEIKKTQESISAHIKQGEAAINAQRNILSNEEKNLYKAQKKFDDAYKSGKINSQADYNYYYKPITEAKIKIEEANKAMKDYGNIVARDSYLIEELNQNLGATRMLSVAMETELNNTVKNLEAEVKAIDDTIDSLNDRKDVLESEKKELQEQLNILNEQKEAIEQTLKNYDAVADAVNEYVKTQTDGIQAQIDALEEERKSIEDYYDNQINALKEQNEERDDAIKKEKALADLANAQNQQKRVYSSARGWTYEADKESIVNAQNAIAEIETDEQIKKLEKERETKLDGFDDRKKEYETQIKAFEEYAKKYSDIASDIQKAENELLADQILGSDWRVKIEGIDEELLTKYRSEYKQFNTQLQTLVDTEIKTLQNSIDAKDKEINKINDEITAYNNYKSTVQNSLSEAKTALEDYKNSVNNAKQEIVTAMSEMEHSTWETDWRTRGYWGSMSEAAVNAAHTINNALSSLNNIDFGAGIAAGAIRSLGFIHGFADGGTVDYTGLAMVHGTKQKAETTFNANDSAKLYDVVHNTPNLMASMIGQAVKLSNFNPLNTPVNNNSTANSISLNIGQVVANNPMEFTKNLDTHLDSYFRKKLTQSYTQ